MIDKALELYSKGDVVGAASEIYKSLENNEDLQGKQVILAHVLLLAQDWATITALLNKGTNSLLTSGWLQSLASGRPVNEKMEPVAWFTYPAIDFLEGISKKEWNVFEWGSGNSTKWWAKRVRSVTAIEDDEKWYQEVSKSLPINAHISFKHGGEYVECINEYPDESFDVIVVDGSQRNATARACTKKVKHDGIIIFDNSDMQSHDEGQIFLDESGFSRLDFWGLVPSYLYKNCTSVYFKTLETLKPKVIPSKFVSSVGLSCAQYTDNSK